MAQLLPPTPAVGDSFLIGSKSYIWNGTSWVAVTTSVTQVSTGTLGARPATADEGAIYVVSGDPTPDNDGKSFIWSDTVADWVEISGADQSANDARYVNVIGDTMTGQLMLGFEPSDPMHAATKEYVDQRILDNLADVDTTTLAPTSGDFLKWDGTNWVPALAPGSIRVGHFTLTNQSWNPLSGTGNIQFARAGVGFNTWCNSDGFNAANFQSIRLNAGAVYELSASFARITGDFNTQYGFTVFFANKATNAQVGLANAYVQGSPASGIMMQCHLNVIVAPTAAIDVVLRVSVGIGNPSVRGDGIQWTVKQIG